MKRHAVLALLLLLAAPAAARAAGEAAPSASASPPAVAALPSLAELERDGYKIGQVHLDIGKIFDESKPGERFFLFRLANRLHRTTRPWVIEDILLFHSGEPVSAARIAESERLLRNQRYFYDARIRPVKVEGDTVDLEVATRDVWSLSAGVNFGRTGGTNATTFKIQDTNFLGIGKDVQVLYSSNVDRTETFAHYLDKNLFGSRVQMELEAGDASDGSEGHFVLGRPFYSLDSRWGVGLEVAGGTSVDTLYDLGHVTDRFERQRRFVEAWGGWSPGVEGHATQRVTGGVTWDRNLFATPSAGFDPVNGTVPIDRDLLYPWVGWERVEDGYIVAHDLDKIERSEDVNLGGQAAVRLGYAPAGWGTNDGEAIVSARYRDGAHFGQRNLFLIAADFGGRFGSGGARDLLASVILRDFVRDFAHGRLLMSLRVDFAHRLDPDHQLLLGGDTGLRGYPLRFQQGDRLVLASVEQRFYDDHEFLHLFRVGAAGFIDVGKVWFADRNDAVGRQLGILRDLGVGLRIGSSRSSRAAMVHLDLAMPLDGPRDISRLQWLVSTSETF